MARKAVHKTKRYFSYDVETTGFDVYGESKMFAFATCDSDGSTEAYRFDDGTRDGQRYLEEFWADTSIAKICHNLKFDYTFTLQHGIAIPEGTELHDTITMSQMLQNLHQTHALADLCFELCGWPKDSDTEIKRYAKGVKDYSAIPAHIMYPYQRADVERTMVLFKTWWPEIQSNELLLKDYRNEIALSLTTQRMEQRGIMLHIPSTERLVAWLDDQLEDVQHQLQRHLGEYVNPNSSAVVQGILRHLGLYSTKKTKRGGVSTDKHVLMELYEQTKHPVLDLILKYKSYAHGKPIVQGYIKLADADGVIHPTIHTNRARTGRQSCTKPNLQNVAKEVAKLNPHAVPARRCFRARPGYINFHADYAGIEIRLIVNVSQDTRMIKAIRAGKDPHALAAECLYGPRWEKANVAEREVLRNSAKNAHFAIAYGAGVPGVALPLGISPDETQPGFERYRRLYPSIGYFTRNIIQQVRQRGYLKTPFGRRLYIPRDKPYVGSNYIIQGTAAGVLKYAEVRLDKYFKDTWDDSIGMLIPIHDELIIECPRHLMRYRERLFKDVKELMCDFPQFSIPMDIGWKIVTSTWDKAKEVS